MSGLGGSLGLPDPCSADTMGDDFVSALHGSGRPRLVGWWGTYQSLSSRFGVSSTAQRALTLTNRVCLSEMYN